MELKKITNFLSSEEKQKKNLLTQRINKAVEDGVVSVEEYNHIINLAEELSITPTDVDFMVQDAFREQFKELIAKFASDGKIDSNEMAALKKRGQLIGITEDDMQVLITEALSNHKEEVKRKVKNTFITIGTVATTVAAGAGALFLMTQEVGGGGNTTNIVNNYGRRRYNV